MQIQNAAKQQFVQVGLQNNDHGLKRRLSANEWMQQQNESGLQIEGQPSYDPNQRGHQNRSHLSQQPGMIPRSGVQSNQSAHIPKHHNGMPLASIQGAQMNPTRTENAQQFTTIGALESKQAKASRNK